MIGPSDDPRVAAARGLLAPTLRNDPLARAALACVLPGPAQLDEGALQTLLRYHDVPVREPREIELREGFDRALAAYSLLEIACFCGAAPASLPATIAAPARALLETAPVRRYYAEIYPLPLVVRLASRLATGDGPCVAHEHAARAGRLFSRFVTIDRGRRGEDVDTFLLMLDDFWWGDVGLPSLIALSRDPEALASSLGRVTERTVLDRAASGLREYLLFARRLHALLERAAPIPGLAETFRLHHAYWLIQARDRVGSGLDALLDALAASTAAEAPSRAEDAEDVRRVVRELMIPRDPA